MLRSSLITSSLVVAFSPLVTGCSAEPTSAADRSAGKGRPTEAEAREAYLDTPLIRARMGHEIVLGSTRADVTEAIGAPSSFTYRRHSRDCTLYPIAGTQRRDEFGGIEADEWEFCFGPGGRLSSRRRIRAGA